VRRLLSFQARIGRPKSNAQNILSVWDLLRDVWMRTYRKRVCTRYQFATNLNPPVGWRSFSLLLSPVIPRNNLTNDRAQPFQCYVIECLKQLK